jgi:hypothetical protein
VCHVPGTTSPAFLLEPAHRPLPPGVLGAPLISQGMGLLSANFLGERFPRAVSAFGPVIGGAVVLGPIVAELPHWR